MPGRARAVIAGLIALSLALTYAVVSETVGGALLSYDPDAALIAHPGSGEALVARAEKRTAEALTDSEIVEAQTAAGQALRASPVSVTALRSLAEAAQLKGEDARAENLMLMAGTRNLRDPKIRLWLFREALNAHRYDQAFLQADLLLRRHSELSPMLYPSLVADFDQPGARNALLALMRGGPPWRSDFINSQAGTGDPSGVTAWILVNLASSPHPPSPTEVGLVATALANQGKWTDVRNIWARFGDGRTLLYNGDFESPPREPPFGWRLSATNGDVAAVEAIDGGANHALYAQFPVGRNRVLAEVLLVLPPGAYRFSGRVKVTELPREAAFQWELRCSQSPSPLVKTAQSTVTNWIDFQADFTVAAEGCDGQWLSLAGVGGEGYLPAYAWYDNLKIQALP